MSVKITIKGTVITLPTSGASPNWSPAIIEAFKAIADAVNSVTGTYDVAPQTQNIDSNNPSSDIELSNLNFPPADVRAATVYYTVYRKTTGVGRQEVTEAGTLEISYNDGRASNKKWEIVRSGQGDASINFAISDLGQIRFSTTAITGDNHTGIVSYRAISILNT
jgi:hypothetical protein